MKNKGREFEKKIQRLINSNKIGNWFDKNEKPIKHTINSGALWFDKGDLKTDDFLIEIKYTEKKSFSITKKILQKIWNEALERNKLPKLIIGIKDEGKDWVLDITLNRR